MACGAVSGSCPASLIHKHSHRLVHRHRIYKEPMPYVSLRGAVIRMLTQFSNRAMAVARLTSLNLSVPLSVKASTPGRHDHSAPVSTSPVWKDKRSTAAVSFAADVVVSMSVRSSRMEGPASPDLLQPSRELSLPIPQCYVSNTGPAAITIAPPAYVLFPFVDSFDSVDTFSILQVSTIPAQPASLRSGRRGRWLCRQLL